MTALKIIVAVVLFGHGVGHILGFLAAWTNLPMGFRDRPWLLGGEVTIQGCIGRAFGLLWLVACVGFVVAAVGLLLARQWWEALAIAASAISLIAILPWWRTVAPSPRVWACLVDVVVLAGLLGPWREQIQRLLG